MTYLLLLTSLKIEQGDVLLVGVFGTKEYKFEVAVLDDCTAFFPLVGNLKVCGMTPDSLADTLSVLLKPYYSLPVVVSFKNLRPSGVVVLGEVRKPGTVSYVKGMTVADAITLAGALPSADLDGVLLNGKRINLRLDNPRVHPGDRIVVPRSRWASLKEFLPIAMNALSLGILVYTTFIKK